MADCHDTAQGWVADVLVPEKAPPGTGTVLWKVAYTRPGETVPGTADGLVTVGVLPLAVPPSPGFWMKLSGITGRVLLGTLAVVALIGYRRIGRRFRDWWQRRRPPAQDDSELPTSVRVVPARFAGRFDVTVSDPEARPRRLIRLSLNRGRLDVRIHGELS